MQFVHCHTMKNAYCKLVCVMSYIKEADATSSISTPTEAAMTCCSCIRCKLSKADSSTCLVQTQARRWYSKVVQRCCLSECSSCDVYSRRCFFLQSIQQTATAHYVRYCVTARGAVDGTTNQCAHIMRACARAYTQRYRNVGNIHFNCSTVQANQALAQQCFAVLTAQNSQCPHAYVQCLIDAYVPINIHCPSLSSL
eukprot:932-Heterococcus_DN1.PRE.5